MAQERAQNQDQIIAEFDGNLRAMADEILRLRHGVTQIAAAVDLMQRGAPIFAILRPGPLWKPKPDEADVR
jgi:hypothetical protein